MKKHISKLNSISRIGLLASGGALYLLLTMITVPDVNQSHAESEDSLTMLTSATIAPTISIATSSKVNLSITPKSTGSFSTSTTALSVATNSSNGYSIYMSTNDGTQNLKYSDTSVDAKITPVAANSTKEQFGANTWGYSLDSGEDKAYQPVPATSTVVEQTSTSSSLQNYELTFGTFIDTNLPAGEYYNAVTISAVANPNTFSSLNDIVYMQQMTNTICQNTLSDNMQAPTTKQLIDTRDGKSYWVAKLADGRCWMTQNLALDITEKGLDTNNTNITEAWNQDSTYKPITTIKDNTVPSVANSDNGTYSWNLGSYVLATPELSASCDMTNMNLGSCKTVSIVNVSNKEKFTPDYSSRTDVWTLPDGSKTPSTTVVVNCTEWENSVCVAGSYNPHYLLGNYYQFNAATAGTGALIASYGGAATGSICPKGWQLPDAGISVVSGTAAYLLKQYGLATGPDSGTPTGTGTDGHSYNITTSPLYMVKGGNLSTAKQTLAYFGTAGFTQSRNKFRDGSNKNYALSFSIDSLISSNVTLRSEAMPIRCINNPDI